jgi:hypothetical protein
VAYPISMWLGTRLPRTPRQPRQTGREVIGFKHGDAICGIVHEPVNDLDIHSCFSVYCETCPPPLEPSKHVGEPHG